MIFISLREIFAFQQDSDYLHNLLWVFAPFDLLFDVLLELSSL